MAKINDLTTFPNTQPVDGDHVIGTDISDVSNSADGEVVTFKFSDIGKVYSVNNGLWQPYDSGTSDWGVYEGDGSDGLIYDFATDGATTTITSPTLEDGYEYIFYGEGLSHSAGFNADFVVTKTYADASTSASTELSTLNSTNTVYFKSEFHRVGMAYVNASNFNSKTIDTVDFSWSPTASFDAGTIKMYRRRSAP